MACDKHNSYRNKEFSDQTPLADFYTFGSVRDLILKIKQKKEEIFRCRTVGILQSLNGHFYLSDIEDNSAPDAPKLLVCIVYLKMTIPSSVIPNAVHIFGTIQWKEKPILIVKILQVLAPAMAIRLKNAITRITNTHLACVKKRNSEEMMA